MVEFKLVIGDPKSGKCFQKIVKDADAKPFLGKVIGEKIKGDSFGLTGYEFEITGGSDYCGFPMRRDVLGPARKKILAVKGVGIRNVKKGERIRKSVAGNTIHPKTSQINLKIITHGKQPLVHEGAAKKPEGEKAEEKKPKK